MYLMAIAHVEIARGDSTITIVSPNTYQSGTSAEANQTELHHSHSRPLLKRILRKNRLLLVKSLALDRIFLKMRKGPSSLANRLLKRHTAETTRKIWTGVRVMLFLSRLAPILICLAFQAFGNVRVIAVLGWVEKRPLPVVITRKADAVGPCLKQLLPFRAALQGGGCFGDDLVDNHLGLLLISSNASRSALSRKTLPPAPTGIRQWTSRQSQQDRGPFFVCMVFHVARDTGRKHSGQMRPSARAMAFQFFMGQSLCLWGCRFGLPQTLFQTRAGPLFCLDIARDNAAPVR